MNTSKFWIVSFLEQKTKSFSFTKWPNHITIVPGFQPTNLEELIQAIKLRCQKLHKITYQVGPVSYFGLGKNIEVSELKNSDALAKLHITLLKDVLENDKNMDTKFCKQNYKPHITHNDEPYSKEHDLGTIKTIYFVEKSSPVTEDKKVVAVVNLS